ncbi:glycosyltransferase, partial [Candidatus Bathyarchaeota archaeon]|nr:glycosyltransferase [Candidatus Bathyarchaeota archaeon]
MQNVSIVLTCYNGARWISRAIESILAQTYEDFELVIIDDGSTDSSKEVVVSHLCDERVHYIHQENRGFSAAVNRGIKESSGNLIGFIGQDDLWIPNKLELQLKYFSEHKDVDLIHSNYYSIDSEGRIIEVRGIKIPNFSSKKKVVEQLFLNNFIGFETVLVKRRCFDEVGYFDEQMVGFSDHDIWLRIAGSFNIGYLDLPLVEKREHEFQLSKVRIEAVLKDEFLMVKKAVDRYPFLERVERK